MLKLTKKSIESVKISGNLNIEPLGGIASEFVVKKFLKEKILEELRKAGFKGKLIVDGQPPLPIRGLTLGRHLRIR